MDELEVLLKILDGPAAFIVRTRKNSVICAVTHATRLYLNDGLAEMPMDDQVEPGTCTCWFSRQLDLQCLCGRVIRAAISNDASFLAVILKSYTTFGLDKKKPTEAGLF
jgi:hypothetical protein